MKISSGIKFFRYLFRDFFPVPNFFDTGTDTFSRYQIFLIPVPRLFPVPICSDTRSDTTKKMKNSQYREFPVPVRHTLLASTMYLQSFVRSSKSIYHIQNYNLTNIFADFKNLTDFNSELVELWGCSKKLAKLFCFMNDSSLWLSNFYYRVMVGLTRKYEAFTISLWISSSTYFF